MARENSTQEGAVIAVNGLTKNFGGLYAVNNLSFTVNQGEILGLIGPNGAGKTTIFSLMTGFLKPRSGEVLFQGKNVVGKSPHTIAGLGIVRTFQIATTFRQYTVVQNIIAASQLHTRFGLAETTFRTPGYFKKQSRCRRHVDSILRLTGLDSVKAEIADTLPHAHQKTLGIGIALAADPKLLMLDEPLEGMNPKEVKEALKIINAIRKQGVTILLIEHNMRAVMEICDRLVVVNFGTKIAEGLPHEIRKDKQVIAAYLGGGEYAH
jgi:branched-chain amino acid transport system ATP-binding protein